MADAICGPVAAIAFARAMGRQPTIAEALEIAKANGRWDPGTGMHGPDSEAALLTDMGVPNRVDHAPTREAVIADVASGNPVILSSPGHYHYFVVTGYDPKTGLFDTGNTGTALRGGSRYRTWEDIGPQAALFMQEPTAHGPSAAVAPTTTSGAVIGATNQPTDIEQYVRERAKAYGIDPDTAVAVANAEGGLNEWNRQSDFVYHGKREESYGPFQLFMSGGLGNAFQQETGLDPRDPANGPAATDWALRYASQHGWGDWHGAQRIGLDNFAGIGGNAGATTPGGTPAGRRNDSPFAPAEQPTVTPPEQPSDPWAQVNATLQDTRDRLARMNQGAIDTLNAGGDALVNEVSRPHPLSGLIEQGVATRPELQAPLAVARAVVPEDVQQGALGVARGLLDQPDFTQPLADPAMEDAAQRAAAADRTGNPRALEFARSAIMGAFGTFGAADAGAADAAGNLLHGKAAGKALLGAKDAFDATRMYHGTGAAFDTPNPATFDPNGLFGPGYYLTDEPRVADSYGLNRQPDASEHIRALAGSINMYEKGVAAARAAGDTEKVARLEPTLIADRQRLQALMEAHPDYAGPNVRAVDVPAGLNLLDAEAPVPRAAFDRIAAEVEGLVGPREFGHWLAPFEAKYRAAEQFGQAGPNGAYLYHGLQEFLTDARRSARFGNNANGEINRLLRDAGYDGIRYAGGRRIPMTDAAGAPIEHTAVVVFPESLPKIRNAISGMAGGVTAEATSRFGPPTLAGDLGRAPTTLAARGVGTVAGGVIGAAAPADTPEERLKHAAIGAGIGLGLDVGAGALSRGLGRGAARTVAAAGGPAERGMAEKVLNLQAEKRANVWDALVTHRAMLADLPKLDDRVAVTHALEEPTRVAALNPKQQAWVQRLKGEFDADWQKAHAAGITDSYLQNYISHIVNKPPEDVARALSTGNRVSTFSQFTRQRTFPTIPELEAWIKQNNLPWTVQKDPAIIQAAHKISLLNAAANNSFLTSLRTMVAADGRPLVEFASKAPDDYATIPHPSLTKYRYAGEATGGGTLLTSSPLAVHPEIAGDLRRFLEPPPSVIPRAYWTAQGLLKRAVMYNPLIHGLNVIGQASMTRATGPFGALHDLLHGEGLLHSDLNAPVIHHYIADHGLNLAALRQFGNELGEQMRGPEDVKGVIGLGKQAIGGPLGKLAAWSDGLLWDHMVSNLQVAIHEHYLQQFMRAGDSEAVAGRRAATISNNLMGMIPPETQSQAARFWGNLLLFARNWTTSNVRMGRGLLGDVPVAGRKLAGVQYGLQPEDTKALAGVYRGQALRGLFWLGATTLAANMAFSGRPNWMNDEGHFFDIDTGRLDALGNHEYVHNPLFKPLQDLIGLTVGTAHAIAPRSGIPDPTGRSGVEVAFNKGAPLLREAGSQALNTDLGQLLRTGQAQHIASVAQDADLLGQVEQRARHLADTLAPGPIAPRLASTIADPTTRAKGLERLGLSLAGLTATQPNLMLSEQQGPEGDELRRLGINTKDPLSKGLSPDAYATYRAGVRQGERQAVAAAIADPRYARLSDDLKKRAILSALSKVRGSESAAAGLNAGHAPDEPPKYDQSKPWVQKLMQASNSADAYALERAINEAVSTTARNRTPLQRRLAYYAQYSTPEWRKWSAGRRKQEDVVREVVGTAVPAAP